MFPVLHEDAARLAIEKPVGVATIPGHDTGAPNVRQQLEAALGVRLWVVHRLDKEVSGLLLFAKTADEHRRLSLLFERREVQKTYLGWVHGTPSPPKGRIAAPVHLFGSGRMGVDPRGKPSVTDYAVQATAGPFALLRLHPHTGRRHQLRVHLYHLGHPLVGDGLYGDPAVQRRFPRLFLHAHALALPLPDGTTLHMQSPLPEAFAPTV